MPRKTRSPLFRLCLAALFAALSLGASAQESALADYAIQPGDVLEISVWREPDLQREVLVRPDGGISFPLVGDMKAQGSSVAALAAAVTERLERYIPDPVVTVTVSQMSGNRIYVLGRVNRPGEFAVLRPVNVLQALSMAGGLTPYADEKRIQVLRGSGSEQQAIPFNYRDVERGQALEQNLVLQAGDVVMVP